ncbi:DUF4307 domain-containing protein [Nocardioides sp. MAH-18]|uniref:DUF4307 domain-containing protein n=1 Tax=Nocardioides agri TaxID=2682843 RepID=A0A6L6XQZ6_9ACTN|nr:DUF4307 domain-containing protein [Nocardioides sp. CGMCC 1.13656]MBA2954144.1 DUF4307 domain-containing protein [Nocardioides sp. CGMCC 1.13656]MVQ49006.1 DUF4307 domain-containing protein [Nocardioides sp. MAH-18]
MSQPTDLADRYGAPSPWGRGVLIGVVVVVAAAFLGWLGWTIWEQSTPDARSELVGYDVVDEHAATATVDVRLRTGDVVATCRLRAYAEDHSVVGEATFTPEDGRNEVDVRTERRATSVELLGCTTPDQRRAR